MVKYEGRLVFGCIYTGSGAVRGGGPGQSEVGTGLVGVGVVGVRSRGGWGWSAYVPLETLYFCFFPLRWCIRGFHVLLSLRPSSL